MSYLIPKTVPQWKITTVKLWSELILDSSTEAHIEIEIIPEIHHFVSGIALFLRQIFDTTTGGGFIRATLKMDSIVIINDVDVNSLAVPRVYPQNFGNGLYVPPGGTAILLRLDLVFSGGIDTADLSQGRFQLMYLEAAMPETDGWV